MLKSYFKNYFKTYFWQGLGVFVNLLSMFVVVPFLTEDLVIFGVYSLCISFSIFLSYADIGFYSAGLKYAAELFGSSNLKNEIKLHAFTSFILFVFVIIISLIFLLFSYNPDLILKDINSEVSHNIASGLFLIQSIFAFNIVFERLVSGVFQVRIEQFKLQRYVILGGLIKIFSVFYFFIDRYEIIGYYTFIKIIDLVVYVYCLILITKIYNFDLLLFLKNFKFNKIIFKKVKGLAFGSLFITLIWILYFEIDLIVIGKFFGPLELSIYALAFTFMKFFRSLSSIVLAPFDSRYNHMIGSNQNEKLKQLLFDVIKFAMPIFIIIPFSILLLGKKIITTWAGIDFQDSSIILTFLILNFMFSYIITTGSSMLKVLVRLKEIYIINFIMLIIFWMGILVFSNNLGILSFAFFKFIAGLFAFIYYSKFIINFLKIGLNEFINQTLVKIILPIIIQVLLISFFYDYLPFEKSKFNLTVVIGFGAFLSFAGFLTLYLTSKYYRIKYNYYFKKIFKT